MSRPWATWCAVAVAGMLATACTKGEVEALPPAPSVPITSSTAVVDLSAIALNDVPGRTTTTVALQPGEATISGTVVGPDGPVQGAVVRAERVVGDATGSIDIISGEDGTFAFTTMVGGRYRVRSWKANPDNLALVTPEVFFLEAEESKVLALSVRPYQGVSVTSDIAPNPPLLDEPANLVVQVVDRTVDAEGIVRGTPLPDIRVELFGAGDWRLRSDNPVTTDANGQAVFELECRRAGQQPLSVVIGDTATFPLDVPACAVPVDPNATTDTTSGNGDSTTTTTSSSTSTSSGSTTSTTSTSSRSTTTTTTRSTPPNR